MYVRARGDEYSKQKHKKPLTFTRKLGINERILKANITCTLFQQPPSNLFLFVSLSGFIKLYLPLIKQPKVGNRKK